eukprot:GFUD01028071.1.p1 GENE.GFUD01028071.1~~GFUD01028071.1.p1  ORF type:complete len:364 (+),score=79.22 GFUD01028071.1:46-1137(+)
MGPKRIKLVKVEEVNYEEEVVALKTALEDKNEELEAFANDHEKQEKTIKNLKLMRDKLEVQVDNDKTEINNLKRKLREQVKAKNIVEQLKEKIECPVCFEIPQTGPVPVCPNGHFICNECKADACPTCRVGMANGKSLLAVTVIENIDHSCKLVDCEEIFPHDKIEEHAKVCSHRTVSCPSSKCDVKVGLSKLLDHLNNGDCSYDDYPVIIEKASLIEKVSAVKTLKFKISEKGRKAKSAFYKLSTFTFEDISFCIYIEKRDWLYQFCFVMFASEDECSKYKIEMTVHEGGATRDDSEVSFKLCGKPCSIDVDKKEFHGLQVDEKGMKQILSKSRNIGFRVSFTIKKIPISQPPNSATLPTTM